MKHSSPKYPEAPQRPALLDVVNHVQQRVRNKREEPQALRPPAADALEELDLHVDELHVRCFELSN